MPEAVALAAYKLHSGSGAVTGYHVFPYRGHSLVLDHGWREIADLTLSLGLPARTRHPAITSRRPGPARPASPAAESRSPPARPAAR